jgi:hypothetical protein
MVMDAIFPESNDDIDSAARGSRYDIVFGHSQGAILMSALLSIRGRLWNTAPPGGGARGYVLNGCAWPNPFGDSLSRVADGRISDIIDEAPSVPPRILFVMGKYDGVNPVESAMRVHDAYRAAGFDVSIVEHDGGHSVPAGKDEDSARALEEVVDWIVDIARRKVSKCM